jgi:hypothetical protein
MRLKLNNGFLVVLNTYFSTVIHIGLSTPRLGAALVLFVSVVDGSNFQGIKFALHNKCFVIDEYIISSSTSQGDV